MKRTDILFYEILYIFILSVGVISFGFAQEYDTNANTTLIEVVLENIPYDPEVLVALIFMNPDVIAIEELSSINNKEAIAKFTFPPYDQSVPPQTIIPSHEFLVCIISVTENEHLLANCRIAKDIDKPYKETIVFEELSDDGNITASLRYFE